MPAGRVAGDGVPAAPRTPGSTGVTAFLAAAPGDVRAGMISGSGNAQREGSHSLPSECSCLPFRLSGCSLQAGLKTAGLSGVSDYISVRWC